MATRETLNRLLGIKTDPDKKSDQQLVDRVNDDARSYQPNQQAGGGVRGALSGLAVGNVGQTARKLSEQIRNDQLKKVDLSKQRITPQSAAMYGGAPVSSDGNTPQTVVPAEPQRQYNNLDDIADAINQLHPVESEEDRAKREKREKSQRVMAAIGDAFNAFAEGYDRARGKTVTPSKSYSQQVDDRILALDKIRQTNYKDRITALERLEQLRQKSEQSMRAEERAEQAAKHQAAQEKYWDEQAKRWANADEVARQRAEEQARANKAKEEETKRTHKANEAIRDKVRQDQKADRAANRAQKERQFNKSEANKDRRAATRGGNNKSTGGSTGDKKHKQNPYG